VKRSAFPRSRFAVAHIEPLVVFAKVRDSVVRTKCASTPRQVVLASHTAHNTPQLLPLCLGYWPSTSEYGTFHFHPHPLITLSTQSSHRVG
jgi:hypothetical protein